MELDDTRDNISMQSDTEAEKPNSSPKKERQDLVQANQELLEYREESVMETSSIVSPEYADEANRGAEAGLLSPASITVNPDGDSRAQSEENESPRSPNEQQMLEMEYLCQVLVEKQQLSEIVEDEREAEGDAALGSKGSKGNTGASQTLDSRNGCQAGPHSTGSSRDLLRTQVKGMGAGLVVSEEETKETGGDQGFDSHCALRSKDSGARPETARETISEQMEDVDEVKEAPASVRLIQASP